MKLTQSQTEKINKIKTAFKYEYGLQDFKIDTSYENFVSISGEGDRGSYKSFFAIIGKKGGIRSYTENSYLGSGTEYKGKKAEQHLNYTLRRMKEKNLYQEPKQKQKKKITYQGISFYNVDQGPRSGIHSIGIERNKTTEKYFQWVTEPNTSGDIIEYYYMMHGGDGGLIIYPIGRDEIRIEFSYEPGSKYVDGYLSVYKIGYEETLKTKLSNRQIIARVFKVWLKDKNLL